MGAGLRAPAGMAAAGAALAPGPAGHQGREEVDQAMLAYVFAIYFYRYLYHSLRIPSRIQKKKGTLHPTCMKSTAPGQDCPRAFLWWKARAGALASCSLSRSLSLALWGHGIIELFRLEETFKIIESNVLVISQ